MTLQEIGISFIAVSAELLEIESKSAVPTLGAIQVYRDKHTDTLTIRSSRYLSRRTREHTYETLRVMLNMGLVEENPERATIDFIEPDCNYNRVLIPGAINYNKLTLAEIRTIIAFATMIRGKHFHGFELKTTWDEFASKAGISTKSLKRALKELSSRSLDTDDDNNRLPGRLFNVSDKIVNAGKREGNKHRLTITMLDIRDAWKGWDLKKVEAAYAQERGARQLLTPHERYTILLEKYADAKTGFPKKPTEKSMVICPFCRSISKKSHSVKPSLIFSSMEYDAAGNEKERDSWSCMLCRRGGTSLLLWGRLQGYMAAGGPEKLQKYLKTLPEVPLSNWEPDPEPELDDEEVLI